MELIVQGGEADRKHIYAFTTCLVAVRAEKQTLTRGVKRQVDGGVCMQIPVPHVNQIQTSDATKLHRGHLYQNRSKANDDSRLFHSALAGTQYPRPLAIGNISVSMLSLPDKINSPMSHSACKQHSWRAALPASPP